jgi:predicted lipoprotein with Yx(FWY)xxD motif
MRNLLAIAAACCVLGAIAGCGGGDDSGDETVAEPATTTTEASGGSGKDEKSGGGGSGSGTVVEVGDSQFGDILTDADGRTLYLFDKEMTSKSECFGACEEAWPVTFTKGEPQAGKGVDQSLLGTTDHDGNTQVTYNGHPLYYYVEEGPNEVLCHNVDEFGGLWLVVDPSSGDAVQ